jgi:hypothetical protein
VLSVNAGTCDATNGDLRRYRRIEWSISVVFFTGLEHSFVMRPSHRHCDKNSIAKRSHASVRSDFRNQTFARERLELIFWCEGLE